MIDMMSPKKKLNGEGGLLCLWASPGPLESAISVNFSYTDLCWLWPLRGRKGKCQVGQRQSNREMVHGFMALSQKMSLQMSKTAEICSTSENVFRPLEKFIFRLWPLRGRKVKCQISQRHSNPIIPYGLTALSQKGRFQMCMGAEKKNVAQIIFWSISDFPMLTLRRRRKKRKVSAKSMKLKSWELICIDSLEPKGQHPNVHRCWEKKSPEWTFSIYLKTPKMTPSDPPGTPQTPKEIPKWCYFPPGELSQAS